MSTLYERLESQLESLDDNEIMVLNNEICDRESSGRFIYAVEDVYDCLYDWFDGDMERIVNALGKKTFDIGDTYFYMNETEHFVSSSDIWSLTYLDKEETIEYLMQHRDFAEDMYFDFEKGEN